jgi:hypothetical protein
MRDNVLTVERCSKCGIGRRRQSHSWCLACHAANMRDTRPLQRDMSSEQKKRANCRAYTKVLQRRGVLPLGPCEVCGDPNAQNHHPDYSKPREFRRLCKFHHQQEHRTETTK